MRGGIPLLPEHPRHHAAQERPAHVTDDVARARDGGAGPAASDLRSALRARRRLAAISVLAITGGTVLALLIARGELAGSDARAYWAGVRIWLAGGDPFHPAAPFLPYVYFPWSIPLFLPWALLPWSVAWFVWRTLNIALFLWSAHWAYRRHPLATAAMVAVVGLPLAATLDTGNITLLLTLSVWAAQFVGPRLGGALWALAATLKWIPAVLIVLLPPRARLWGLAWASLAILLALATFPLTVVQIRVAIDFPRPLRLDYLLLLWAAVPWLWRQPHPIWWLDRTQVLALLARTRQRGGMVWRRLREDPEGAAVDAGRHVRHGVRAFFGVG